MDLAEYLIPAVAGLLSGAVGSLVAPWVQWGIEARRERMKARRTLLSQARELLANPPPIEEFRMLPLYFQLKQFLKPSTIVCIHGQYDEWGNEAIVVVTGGPYGGVNPYAHEILHNLSVIERKWKLV
jgi:hypothetical protein